MSTISSSKQSTVFDNTNQLKIDNLSIGSFGKISDEIINQQGLDNSEIFGFEIDLGQILNLLKELKISFKPINYLPKVERDINFVVDETIKIGDIVNSIEKYRFSNLISIEPLNIFRDASIGKSKKAITLNFHFQNASKTLEDNDVNLVINEIINVVSKNFSAKLR